VKPVLSILDPADTGENGSAPHWLTAAGAWITPDSMSMCAKRQPLVVSIRGYVGRLPAEARASALLSGLATRQDSTILVTTWDDH